MRAQVPEFSYLDLRRNPLLSSQATGAFRAPSLGQTLSEPSEQKLASRLGKEQAVIYENIPEGLRRRAVRYTLGARAGAGRA